MRDTVPAKLLGEFSQFITHHLGLHFPSERWTDLERGMRVAAEEFQFGDMPSCIQWLMSAPLNKSQIQTLANSLTVGETYFFRDKRSFEILEEHILPELVRNRSQAEKRLRLWSAACCTGEESYSLAISLQRTMPDLRDWQVTILATDINPRFLQKASEGVYGEWSFRDNPPSIRERYFKEIHLRRFEILPEIKQTVTFGYLNLAEDNYPSLSNNTNAMDLIFCRNVLMYFSADQQKRVIDNFYRCLAEAGWLVVSPSEVSQVLFSQFETVNYSGATLYRKDSRRPPAKQSSAKQAWLGGQREVSDFDIEFRQPAPSSSSACPPSYGSRPCGAKFSSPENRTPPASDSYEQAVSLCEQGNYADAIQEALSYLSTRPNDDAKAMALLARACANQGKLDQANEWSIKAIAADKLNAGLHYLRATILHELGQFETAVASLKRALYLDPTFVLAHFALGNHAFRLGKRKEAKKHFENTRSLLSACPPEGVLPESEGITVRQLLETIESTKRTESST